MTNLRAFAAIILDEVTRGSSLTASLDQQLSLLSNDRDRAFVQAICFGVCRYYPRLESQLEQLLEKPLKSKDNDIKMLLLVGLYQLMEMRVPPHAAVAETVSAVIALHKPWARGLTNAVLRAYLRRLSAGICPNADSDSARYSHPQWWIDAIKKAWPMAWEEIFIANNAHPPFALRVNARQMAREQYQQVLAEQGIQATAIPDTRGGLVLEAPLPVAELPGFATGAVSVQDGAAQLAAQLLVLDLPGLHLLDACAAPGGKLSHCLEIAPTLSAVAVDKDEARLAQIKDNLDRLQLTAVCHCADVGEVSAWWDGQLFDRILLDAPCSASGVIRRHPDIKLLRQPQDLALLVQEQARLLRALWPLLTTDGILLYATCSIFPRENVEVVQAFLAEQPDAMADELPGNWGVPCAVGRQILPGRQGMDGFYYARLQKVRK